MFQVRIHGRGGQGVVTAAELLSIAAFLENRHAQAFPTFGSERTGAPVVAFCRIDDKPIRVREPIAHPDALIIQDATLLRQINVFDGVGPDAYVLINTTRDLHQLGGELGGDHAGILARPRPERVRAVPATELARKHLGRPLPNAVLLGGFAALSGVISPASVRAAIREKFSGRVAEGNIAAADEAYAYVRDGLAAETFMTREAADA
ncbi:2-oxoacid:acceptor oxidoreductase family protein [Thermopolyspora sp. NPDC052614]|uniref:2-oxoacid:acceptor oxidoreductase family protein n=1 Tax=Thermopolyspora sp. NPDC052614 TaxID=3155682 RepID=UPI003428DFB0